MANKTRSTPPTAAQKRLAAERAAAARARIQAGQRRKRIAVVIGAVGGVVVLVAALLIVKVAFGDSSPKSGKRATAAASSVTGKIASVPAGVFASVKTGSGTTPPKKSDTPALTSGGKPEVLYIGAEFCPYCAGERWPVAVALSRFGTFHDLGEVRSSPSDVYPSTATLSFHGATYTSKYLSFVGKEVQSNQVVGGNYGALDKLDAQEKALFSKASGYPYVNLGGKYLLNQVQYDPAVLKGRNQQQIASQLSDPGSDIAKSVVGSANRLTADLCSLTGGKPTSVCSSAGVTAAADG